MLGFFIENCKACFMLAARRHVFICLMVYVLPNVVFFLAARILGVGRPIVNIDYAIVALVLAFGSLYFGVFLAVVFLLVDFFVLFMQVVPVVRIDDFVYILSFAMEASFYHLILFFFIGVLVVFLLGGICYSGRRLGVFTALLVFNFLALISVFQSEPLSATSDRFYRMSSHWWVKSQVQLFFRARSDLFLALFDDNGLPLVPLNSSSASTPFWLMLSSKRDDARLMLIVAESWGQTSDLRIQEKLLQPLRALPGRQIDQGEALSSGMTLAGELRELCHLVPMHYNLKSAEKGFEQCLPNQLRAIGYETLSLHAATGIMYDRIYWYPRVGFDHSIFFESRIWPYRCYSFPGGCDADMFDEVQSFFQKPGRRFLYWLTLNSHAPYDMRDLRYDRFDCVAFTIESSSEVCRNLKLQAQFFEGVASVLAQDVMRDVRVIIVGDHEPVIMNIAEKNKYFVSGRVPWVYLR